MAVAVKKTFAPLCNDANTATLLYSHADHSVAELENTSQENMQFEGGAMVTHKEVFSTLLDKLSEHYNVDMHKLVTL
ncbi:MAG: hypothetical protein FWC39_08410 [Bacteroidetes bacterium]|nr:hypothetical protein [Bacteroidota bacterium]